LKKTLIYSHTGLTSKQIGLTTEIIEGLVNEAKDIRVLLCDNVLHNCYFNRTHNVLGCASCQSRQRALLNQAGVKSENLLSLQKFKEEDLDLPEFRSTEELMDFSYGGIDIGRGVASSIISLETSKAISVVKNIQDLYSRWAFDEVYIFNGRFAETWPVVKFAKNNSIPFFTMEAGAHDRYELFENALPHSMKARHVKIEKYWREADISERLKIGNEWFNNRRGRIEKFEHSFVKDQVNDQLPIGFDTSIQNICIFNSSEDEMASISEYQNDIYKNQNDAINQILEHYNGHEEIQFYLRLHPNLAGVDNAQTKEIYALDYPNLTVIKPTEKIDTYALMDACVKTISFGSSTGIEATYWGKPSILFGKAFYMYLDCVYNPQSFDELRSLIDTEDLTPIPKETTLPFGYFMMTFGKKPIHFKFDGIDNSKYKNKKINKFYPSTPGLIVKYMSNYKLWKKLHKLFYGSALSLKGIFKYK